MLWTAKELGEYLNIGRDRSYALMRASGFPSIKIGSRFYVTQEAVDEWLKRYAGRKFLL